MFADLQSNAQFRRYSGQGSFNDVPSWSAPQEIGHAEYVHLAGGPTAFVPQGANLSMRVAIAPDHIGVAAWEGANATIRVLALAPDAGK